MFLRPPPLSAAPVFRAPRAPRLPEGWGAIPHIDSPEVTIDPAAGQTVRPSSCTTSKAA